MIRVSKILTFATAITAMSMFLYSCAFDSKVLWKEGNTSSTEIEYRLPEPQKSALDTKTTAKPNKTPKPKVLIADRIFNNEEIIIATCADYPPFEYLINGEVNGLDFYVMQEIANGLNVDLKIVNKKTFDDVFSAVSNGSADIAISAISPTKQRKASFDFTIPYFYMPYHILVRNADKDKLKQIEDLDNVSVGGVYSLGSEEIMKNQLKNSKHFTYKTNEELYYALTDNEIDALVCDDISLKSFTDTGETQKLTIELNLEDFGICIILPKGNEELLKKLNEIIELSLGNKNLLPIFYQQIKEIG